MPAPPIPDGFKLSSKILRELPEGERATAREVLWEKAAGKCALCGTALPLDGKLIHPDHKVARKEGAGGLTVVANLNLTHGRCNKRRGNSMRFDLARKIVTYLEWCELEEHRAFSAITEQYVESPLESISYEISDDRIKLSFGANVCEVALYEDPATEVNYCFAEVPPRFIWDDVGFQPRWIEPDHVRNLAIDFDQRPVHEPSNCRLTLDEGGVANLFQFDGQHKTTAQLILGRDRIPMKIYVIDASHQVMLQELILQVQNNLTTRRLSTYQTLKKANQLIVNAVDTYLADKGSYPTETELVDAQPLQERGEFTKALREDFVYQIFNDDRCVLQSYASQLRGRSKPTTEKIAIDRMIRPLMCQSLLSDDPMDKNDAREIESAKVIEILNLVCELMVDGSWDPKQKAADESHETVRARNFFLGGAVRWWMTDLLIPALETIAIPRQKTAMFTKALDPNQKEQVEGLVSTLCSWDIWSTATTVQVEAWKSNALPSIRNALSGWHSHRLITDFNARTGD